MSNFFTILYEMKPGESIELSVRDLNKIVESEFPKEATMDPYTKAVMLHMKPRSWHYDDFLESLKEAFEVVHDENSNKYIFTKRK